MAAVTVASSKSNVEGALRKVYAKLTAPADGDTWDTGRKVIHNVQCTLVGATQATTGAADSTGVNSVSGGTITFEVVGTARDVYVAVVGL